MLKYQIKIISLLACITFCQCEDEITSQPIGNISTSKDVLYFPGSTVWLKGRFRDEVPLTEVRVKSNDLEVDEIIDLTGRGMTQYFLDLPVKLPAHLPVGIYEIEIVVINELEVSSDFNYVVDYVKLPFTEGLVLHYEGKVGDQIPLTGELFDELGLFRYRFICLGLDVTSDVRIDGAATSYKLSETFPVHPNITPQQYPATFEITNIRKLTYQVNAIVEITE